MSKRLLALMSDEVWDLTGEVKAAATLAAFAARSRDAKGRSFQVDLHSFGPAADVKFFVNVP
jgi:hypothetical protein